MSHTPERSVEGSIVSVYEEFFSGGARILHTDMLIGLQQRGWNNTVLTIHDRTFREETLQYMEQDASYGRLLEAGVSVVSMGRRALNGLDTSPFTSEELELARNAMRNADIVLSLKEQPVRLLNQLHGLDCPAIACLHRSDPDNQGPALDELVTAAHSGIIEAVTTCAESSKEAYSQVGVPADIIQVIPNGIDLERFQPNDTLRRSTRAELSIGDEDPVVLLVARFDTMKNIPLFVEAAGKYLHEHPAAHVVMCGGGMTTQNEQLINMLHGSFQKEDEYHRTHLLGIRRDMQNVYPVADVIALTSNFGEAYPLCLLEGMACGVVPVSTDVGDTARILEGRGIITPFESDAIAKAWHYAILHKNAYQLSNADRRQLGRDLMVDGYERVIRHIIEAADHEGDHVAAS